MKNCPMVRILPLVLLFVAGPSRAALDCTKDVDTCARTLIAETSGFVTACGEAYPNAKELFDKTFKNWPVLKLQIPGLSALLEPDAPEHLKWAVDVSAYLAGLPPAQRQASCTAKLEMLTAPTPTLTGDSAQLPPGALSKYPQQTAPE